MLNGRTIFDLAIASRRRHREAARQGRRSSCVLRRFGRPLDRCPSGRIGILRTGLWVHHLADVGSSTAFGDERVCRPCEAWEDRGAVLDELAR